MSNNFYNLSNLPSMPERILSALAYFSFGIVGIVLIILSAILKIGLKPFVKFNAYQAVLIGFIFGFIQLTVDLINGLFQLILIIPFLGKFLYSIFRFIMFYLIEFPLFFGFAFLQTCIILLLLYLMVMTILGKSPYIPVLSDAIKRFV